MWIIGRTKTDGPADYDAVHKIQAGYKITPLSQWGKEPVAPEVKIDPTDRHEDAAEDRRSIPCRRTSSSPMRPSCSSCTRRTSPTSRSIARLKRIGFEAGKSFDLDEADPAVKTGLATAPEDAQKLMAWKVPTLARIANGWSMNTDTMGVYGNYYLKRAIVTQFGLGANLPGGCDLSAQPRRRRRASRSTAPSNYIDPFRQERDTAGERVLVDHALRS